MATVELTPEAAEQAERLPKAVHDRVLALVERLRQWPTVSGVKALSGNLAGWYRLRDPQPARTWQAPAERRHDGEDRPGAERGGGRGERIESRHRAGRPAAFPGPLAALGSSPGPMPCPRGRVAAQSIPGRQEGI